jgi:hypothetical protein
VAARPFIGGNSKVKDTSTDPNLKNQMVFDYYKQQRDEFMNLSRERASLSLQFLVILGALSLVFNQARSDILKLGVAAVLVLLGSLGLLINRSIERELQMHVARARAARKSLGFLEQFATEQASPPLAHRGIRQDRIYSSFMILILIVGVIYALTALLQ